MTPIDRETAAPNGDYARGGAAGEGGQRETEERGRIAIRPMAEEEVAEVAEIHGRELPDDFLPSLGRTFLVNAFYRSHLRHPFGTVLVAGIPGGPIVGFVCVATWPARYTSWLIRENPLRLVRAMLGLAVRRPGRIAEAVAIALHPAPVSQGVGEVAFIAIDHGYQGLGIGPQLVEAANDYLGRRGILRACTKTLEENRHVIGMYWKRWGARVTGRFTILRKAYVYLEWETVRSRPCGPSGNTRVGG